MKRQIVNWEGTICRVLKQARTEQFSLSTLELFVRYQRGNYSGDPVGVRRKPLEGPATIGPEGQRARPSNLRNERRRLSNPSSAKSLLTSAIARPHCLFDLRQWGSAWRRGDYSRPSPSIGRHQRHLLSNQLNKAFRPGILHSRESCGRVLPFILFLRSHTLYISSFTTRAL